MIFARAREIAEQTPDSRNRAADFFRAVSILMVISGHWLAAAPYFDAGEFRPARLLAEIPWTQYGTWVFQVMPVFFLVGGFANAASWDSARGDPIRRREWHAGRLQRLLRPTVPLILLWCAIAVVVRLAELPADLFRNTSRAALIPIWFLAVYVVVTVATPLTLALWRRFGLASFAVPVGLAAGVDLLGLGFGAGSLRWANYAFVWVAIHQLGYWWHAVWAGRRSRGALPMVLLVLGASALGLLVGPLGYPVSMVSVPGEDVSNSSPPTMALLALGCVQVGAMALIARPASRWLQAPRPWTGVILISRYIMTVYLWHMTALVVLIGLALVLGGIGLGPVPGTSAWWLTRPLWLAALGLALVPFIVLFGRLEARARRPGSAVPGPAQAVAGAMASCAGLTFLALQGAGGGSLGVNLVPALLALAGVALATIGGRPR